MKIYISGPMSGIPEFNYPLFNRIASELRAAGHQVFNPAECLNGEHGHDWKDYMRECVPAVQTCDAIVLLNNATKSKGALIEMHIASGLGLTFYALDAGVLSIIPPPQFEIVER